jgi:hypothetical protein
MNAALHCHSVGGKELVRIAIHAPSLKPHSPGVNCECGRHRETEPLRADLLPPPAAASTIVNPKRETRNLRELIVSVILVPDPVFNLGAAEYKHVVLGLIFLKYIERLPKVRSRFGE